MSATRIISLSLVLASLLSSEATPQSPPRPGDTRIQLIAPKVIELFWVSSVPQGSTNTLGNYLPSITNTASYQVLVDQQPVNLTGASVRQRALYGTDTGWDLRMGDSLFLIMDQPIGETNTLDVSVNIPGFLQTEIAMTVSPSRTNPVFHVSQAGYPSGFPKRAMLGYYLSTLGELPGPTGLFYVLDANTASPIFQGQLTSRPDLGFIGGNYSQVVEANLDALDTPGNYRLYVPGYGCSEPFHIGQEFGALLARTYANGMLQQRCGTDVGLPYTRFPHAPCHTNLAGIPNTNMAAVQLFLSQFAQQANPLPGQSVISNLQSCLYPYCSTNSVDVHGGHHDAGDYSRYMINCALLSHYLLFAVDTFPKVNQLDNLGIPESGDGIPDVLQEAKWEIDAIQRMQDSDGGFFTLVYPENMKYEQSVLPENGAHQVVYPKTIDATARAVAILAQAACSPTMGRYYPDCTNAYLQSALKGSSFIQNAFNSYGKTAAMQLLSYEVYNGEDALAWAYCELYLATGQSQFHDLLRTYNPSNINNKHWGWVGMDAGFGCAWRSYGFAAINGTTPAVALDPTYLQLCQNEAIAWETNLASWAQQSAYGTSMYATAKHMNSEGWYFSSDNAYDIAVGLLLNTNDSNGWAALVSNLAYEAGCNPINQPYITGIGSRRFYNIPNQYSDNDRRHLPVTGLPIGNVRGGTPWLPNYQSLLGQLTYPGDGTSYLSYPMYDRATDVADTSCEQIGPDVARAISVSAFLMAQTCYLDQPWSPTTNSINIQTNSAGAYCTFNSSIAFTNAEFVWESYGNPLIGTDETYTHTVLQTGDQWVEAEFLLPDGRRLNAASSSYPASVVTDPAQPTFSITTVASPAVYNQASGYIRISRDITTASNSISYTQSGGATVNWLSGTDYHNGGTLNFAPGVAYIDLSISAKPQPDDYVTRDIIITLVPSTYNIAYPGYASCTVIYTNANGVTNPNSPPPATTNNVVPPYTKPPILTNGPALSVAPEVLATLAAALQSATNIDAYQFFDPEGSGVATSDSGNSTLLLTNCTSANGYLYVTDLSSSASNTIFLNLSTNLHGLVFSGSIYVNSYLSYGVTVAGILSFAQSWSTYAQVSEDKWSRNPSIIMNTATMLSNTNSASLLGTGCWHDIQMQIDSWGSVVYVDGTPISAVPSSALKSWLGFRMPTPVKVMLGQFRGALRNVQIQAY